MLKQAEIEIGCIKDIMHYWQSITREYIQHLKTSVGHRQSSNAKDL